MEETVTKKKLRNYAFAEGYLRESTLKQDVTKAGAPCIKGDVVVAIDRFNAQRIHVFAMATKNDGTENKAYTSLLNVIVAPTMASCVSSLPNDGVDLDDLDEKTWEAVTRTAAKVWFSGTLEEYATISVTDEKGKEKEKETSSFSFRASNGSIRRDKEKHPFTPRCNVELDGIITSIRDEVKKGEGEDAEPEETGRKVIGYLWVDYKGVGHEFKLYAGNDSIDPEAPSLGTYASYVEDNYEVGNLAQFNVAIVNLIERVESGKKGKSEGWGQVSETVVRPTFVHELRIYGGRSKIGLGEDSPLYVSKDDQVAAATKRRVLAKENWERSQKRKNEYSAKNEPASSAKGFVDAVPTSAQPAFPDFDDSDF